MINLDPFETIELFRDKVRAQDEANRKRDIAWQQKNEQIVSMGTELVDQGLDQMGLHAKMWDAAASHVALIKRLGIRRTGRREDRVTAYYDELDIASSHVALPGGLLASVHLKAKSHPRGQGFHDLVESEGIDYAINRFLAPDICEIAITERTTSQYIMTNALDPGDFTAYDAAFFDVWGQYSSPFRRYREFTCEMFRGQDTKKPTLDKQPMSRQHLIFGAGLWAVHTAWIQEINHYAPHS